MGKLRREREEAKRGETRRGVARDDAARDACCRWGRMRAIVTTAVDTSSPIFSPAIYRFCPRFLSSIRDTSLSYAYDQLVRCSCFHYRSLVALTYPESDIFSERAV